METYKKFLFEKYFKTHIASHEGAASLDFFRFRQTEWQYCIRKFLPESKDVRILDVGCGNGAIVWWLQQLGYSKAEGIDLCQDLIEQGTVLGVNNLQHGDFKELLQHTNESYHMIIFRDVLEHFAKPEIMTILQLCHSALLKDGILWLQVPNAESPFFGSIFYGDFTHETAFTRRSLSQILSAVDFTGIYVMPVRQCGKKILMLIKIFFWKIVEKLYKFLLVLETGHQNYIVSQDIIVVARK